MNPPGSSELLGVYLKKEPSSIETRGSVRMFVLSCSGSGFAVADWIARSFGRFPFQRNLKVHVVRGWWLEFGQIDLETGIWDAVKKAAVQSAQKSLNRFGLVGHDAPPKTG
jgi:hypothetical protein